MLWTLRWNDPGKEDIHLRMHRMTLDATRGSYDDVIQVLVSY
jgi:hypothetical protein